ncbi:transcription regulator [Mesoplasma florum L1]|uniref:Transcription regulator n=3 Tax=Mesoplasma florum TaxID=2151 RepID=Q6F1F0_MESFL|nr:transcription regulator [Mesoplasma florum L1]ATI73956.1 GntR family transcriptional regulator [Mesoplasma florum]
MILEMRFFQMDHGYIYSYIENKILSNEFSADQKMLSENQICIKFNVSRTLARDVYKELVVDGYLYSIHGKGYFVNDKKYWMKNIGLDKKYPHSEYKNEILDFKIELPNWFVENYKLNKNDYNCFTKARYLNNKQRHLSYVFLNNKLILNMDLKEIKKSVVNYLKKDFEFKKSYNFIKIEKATKFDADFFSINENDFIVCQYSVIYHNDEIVLQCSLDKRPIEYLNFGYIANV